MEEQNREEIIRLDEEDFLETLGVAFQQYGYDPQLLESEEYPLTLNMELKDKDGFQIDVTIMFVPLEFMTGDEVQVLQIYFHVCSFDVNLPREKLLEIEHAVNFCSCNCPMGTFGAQPNVGALCCKQGLSLRGTYGDENCLAMALDAFLLMLTSINAFYDGLDAIAKGTVTLEKAQETGLLPTPKR